VSPSVRDSRMLHGFGWSTMYLVVTRASALVAVPVVLHDVGSDLYAVWVLAGALVMIQSLFDLGVASAVVRYVAHAASAEGGARASVLIIARRAMIFYLLLSAAVFLPMWFYARNLVGLVNFLKPDEVAAAVVIMRWAAVAFVLTNIVMVAASVLQGINHVGASYRDQTIGWLLYLPLLVVGMRVVPHAQALGIAWVGAYTVQMLLLLRSLIAGMRSVSPGFSDTPGVGEMLAFGSRWQVSAWADFATFQLPRFIAGVALSSGDVVSLDVAIRAALFVVAPLFAFYPTVLPKTASLLARGGEPALRAFLQPYYSIGLSLVVIGVSVFIPVEVPALAAWTGRATNTFDPLVVAVILIGTAAYASTGLLSSAQLARGEITPILIYKGRQLLLAVVLLPLAALLGLLPVAVALSISLFLPAIAFNLRTAKELGLGTPLRSRRTRWSLAGFALMQVAIPMTLVLGVGDALRSWQLLGLVSLAALSSLLIGGFLLVSRVLARDYRSGLAPWRAAAAPTSIADHLARK
jgi:O-antigen/teichoic acid export membrane protein